MSDSVPPHRRQATRLPCPWDSPGKNAWVGCHFLLQCMKVKSESEVAQLCLTLSDPMDCSLPGSSVHGIFQARVLAWGAIAFSDLTLRAGKTYSGNSSWEAKGVQRARWGTRVWRAENEWCKNLRIFGKERYQRKNHFYSRLINH